MLYDSYKRRCRYLLDKGLSYEELEIYSNFKDLMTQEEFKEVIRLKKNRKNKRYRTKEKFKEIIELYNLSQDTNKNLIFGTITLNNKTLNQKENTYIRKIHAWIKAHFAYTILNKDFGKKGTKREHYHFVGLTLEPLKQVLDGQNKPKSQRRATIYMNSKKATLRRLWKPQSDNSSPLYV